MSATKPFAVVKFINEQDDMNEVVQEVPASWLTKNNTVCKWPLQKYANIYISKLVAPEENWIECPVVVECFCDTLREAKLAAKNGDTQGKSCGRGQRLPKPTDYFSPADEEEREEELRKEQALKRTSILNGISSTSFQQYLEKFTDNLLDERNMDKSILLDAPDEDCSQTKTNEGLVKKNKHHTEYEIDTSSDTGEHDKEQPRIIEVAKPSSSTPGDHAPSNAGVITEGFVISDSEILDIKTQLKQIIEFLSDTNLRVRNMEETLEKLCHQISFAGLNDLDSHKHQEDIPYSFPLNSLEDLEGFESFLKENDGNKKKFVRIIKSVGGNSFKDFFQRICKHTFTNTLADLCSWFGRKGNYAVGSLLIMGLIYDVVHQKYPDTTKKAMEGIISEWLRHARQRKNREKNENV